MDILNAIMDPELGRSAFTVERLTYTRTAEETTSRSATYQAMGCVHPGTPEMIQLLPEEERHEEFITIYTDFALSLGSDHGSSYCVHAVYSPQRAVLYRHLRRRGSVYRQQHYLNTEDQ